LTGVFKPVIVKFRVSPVIPAAISSEVVGLIIGIVFTKETVGMGFTVSLNLEVTVVGMIPRKLYGALIVKVKGEPTKVLGVPEIEAVVLSAVKVNPIDAGFGDTVKALVSAPPVFVATTGKMGFPIIIVWFELLKVIAGRFGIVIAAFAGD